jgi:hypothetical protein
VYEVRPGPRWTLSTRFQGRVFHAERTAELETAPDRANPFGGGGGAGATYRLRRFAIRADGFGLGGEGGVRAGGSIDSRTHIVWDRLALDTRGYALYFRDELDPARRGYSVALQAGGNLKLAHGVYLHAIGEQMFTSYLRTAFRALGVLSIDWNFRVGQR